MNRNLLFKLKPILKQPLLKKRPSWHSCFTVNFILALLGCCMQLVVRQGILKILISSVLMT